jgi:23S rRNA pseudouridine1911/1915/1917 synthase
VGVEKQGCRWEDRVRDIPDGGVRIDRYVSEVAGLFARSQLRQRNPRFFINGKVVKASSRVYTGDRIALMYEDQPEPSFGAQAIDLSIIYEDEHVIVVDKPQGLVVHPAAGNWSGTLVQGLLYHCRELGERFGEDTVRPGIVHRLDKDTSGVLIAAKDPETRQFLAEQFANRRCKKRYIALVKGDLSNATGRMESGIIRDPKNRKRFTWTMSGGKPAVTEYTRLRRGNDCSLAAFNLLTGRTHQIRVHTLMLGHPVIGDPIYGRKNTRFPDLGLMLHSMSLEILLPGEREPRRFIAPLPERFRAPLQQCWGLDYRAVDPD